MKLQTYSISGVKAMLFLKVVADEGHFNLDVAFLDGALTADCRTAFLKVSKQWCFCFSFSLSFSFCFTFTSVY